MTPENWQRIEELFQTAVDNSLAHDAKFLDGIPADIRAEVVSLIAAHEEAATFLSMPPLFQNQGSSNELPYSEIGPYRIDREIGAGGMGTVYAASRADQQFDQRVALKVVRAELNSEPILARFRTERQILATLEHPNIARLLDGGVTPDGRPYLVTELIEGAPLDEYCASRNISVDARLELFGKVCAAVQYAHERLVIHRDLKPGNILVDSAGEPKLLDFGIAKLMDPEHENSAHQTQEMRLLTPRCASPEQISNDVVTTASDIYSLGVVFYELLAWRHPFLAEPSGHSREQLPGDLDNVISMALRKDPERRYRSAAEFAEDIRRYRQNLPVAARKETLVYLASKFVARHKLPVLAALTIIAMLIGGVAVTAYEARLARQERAKAEFVENFVTTTLSGADPTYNSPFADKGRDLRVADVLDVASARARSELKSQPVVASELLREFGIDYMHLGLYDEAERVVHEALSREVAILGPHAATTKITERRLNEILAAKAQR